MPPNTATPRPPSGSGDSDLMILIVVGISGLGFVAAAVLAGWRTAVAWMVDHAVLLPATQDPAITVPAAGGAGMDLARLGVVIAGVVAIVALSTTAVGRIRERQEGLR